MSNIVIVFGKSNWETSKFPAEGNKRDCYEALYNQAREQGLNLYRASCEWFADGVFTHAHGFDGSQWQKLDNIKPDLILDKSKASETAMVSLRQISKTCPIVNDLDFRILLDNKVFTRVLFPEHTVPTYLVCNSKGLAEKLSLLRSEKAVLKPLSLSGGDGIIIDTKERIATQKIASKMILQEFVETNEGIEGITEGRHDMRIVVIDGKIIYASVRTPAEGKLLANIAQGGTAKIIPSEQIPQSAQRIIAVAEKKFAPFGSTMYAIDFMFAERGQKAYVVEFNTRFGLYFAEENYIWRDKVYEALLGLFVNYMK